MVDVSVCIGTACHLNGSHNVVASFKHLIEENNLHDKINFAATFCAGQCTMSGVAVKVQGELYRIDPADARNFFKEKILPLV